VVESAYVSIQRAAQLCHVSDKTIQRAIRAGKLPARYPQPNRCQIALSDLNAFKPGHVSGHTTESQENRIARLEERVQQLERQLGNLLSRQDTPRKRRATPARERNTGLLPSHLVSLFAFAHRHNVSEQKVLTHATMDISLLKAVRGEWTDTDGAVVTLALDAKGRTAFYRLYHGVPPFVECQDCPH
jgi:polyhydroxyalkanoate synthesis regulator phasin